VAAWKPGTFCNFYLVKNQEIANNSKNAEEKKIITDFNNDILKLHLNQSILENFKFDKLTNHSLFSHPSLIKFGLSLLSFVYMF
jgi:hypothetical protein